MVPGLTVVRNWRAGGHSGAARRLSQIEHGVVTSFEVNRPLRSAPAGPGHASLRNITDRVRPAGTAGLGRPGRGGQALLAAVRPATAPADGSAAPRGAG
jgi:hypothetical protein